LEINVNEQRKVFNKLMNERRAAFLQATLALDKIVEKMNEWFDTLDDFQNKPK
jgi:hypothetical protein